MPLYEYECEAGHRFELIRKFADPPVETCPECGRPVHKLMSSPAFQFKGTGWYITDYARKDSASTSSKGEKAEKADKTSDASKSEKSDSAAAKTETKGESKAETKSESKTESKPADGKS
jgi:putative FmdB family regulatory protein